jgi:hypothetical protein
VGAGWIMSNENFMRNTAPFISFLKPKLSYGTTGNSSIQSYGYMNLASSKFYANEIGLIASQIGYDNLSWEKATLLNAGLDFGVFGNRISGSVDVYSKITSDLILPHQVYGVNGYNTILENVGEIKNSGVEFALYAQPVSGEFIWDLSFNISFNKNKVTIINETITYDFNRVEEGKPLGYFYLPEYAGVDPANGDALYKNESGELTNNYSEAEFQDAGDPNPGYFGGVQNTFMYKGFDLSVLLQFVGDVDVYMAHGTYMMSSGNGIDNQTKDQLDRWQKPGDITNVPQARLYGQNGTRKSSRYVFDASYLRLKEISLGYNLPVKFLQSYNIENIRFYVTGINLLTLTDYIGYDPEVSSANFIGSSSAYNVVQGVDMYTTPQPASITFGIHASF